MDGPTDQAVPTRWRQLLSGIKQDRQRIKDMLANKLGYQPVTWFFEPAFLCAALYRLSHYCHTGQHPKMARLLCQSNSIVSGADIHPASDIGAGLLISSPCGVTFSGKAGGHLTLQALSGVGGSYSGKDVGAGNGLPVIGDHVTLNAFVGVQKAIRVGGHSLFQPGACTTSDVTPYTQVALAIKPSATIPTPSANHATPYCCTHHLRLTVSKSDFISDVQRYLDELACYLPGQMTPSKYLSAMLTNPLLGIFVYRLSHWLFVNGWPKMAVLASQCNALVFKLSIHPSSCIGGGLYMPHPAGVVFNGRAGRYLSLYDNGVCTSLDGKVVLGLTTSPILGDHVSIGGHAGIFGAVTVGSQVRIAPKVQVCQDIAANNRVFSPMARPQFKPGDRHGKA